MISDRKKFRTEIPNMADDLLDPFQYRLYAHYKRWASDKGSCTESVTTTAERTSMSRDKVMSVRNWLQENGWIKVEEMARGTFRISIVDRWDENLARFSAVDISTELYERNDSSVDISTSPVDISTSPVDISTLRNNFIERTSDEVGGGGPPAPAHSVEVLDDQQNGAETVQTLELMRQWSRDKPKPVKVRMNAQQAAIVAAAPPTADPPLRVQAAGPLPPMVNPNRVIGTPNYRPHHQSPHRVARQNRGGECPKQLTKLPLSPT